MLPRLSYIRSLVVRQKFWEVKQFQGNKYSSRREKANNTLTLQHIINAKDISGLFRNIKFNNIYSNEHFSLFIKKITILILQAQASSKSKKIFNQEEINYLSEYFFLLKIHLSPQLNSSASDLLIYQLFFKKMKDILGDKYQISGFQIRTTIVSESLTNIVSMNGWQPISISLLHYMSTMTSSSKDNLKKKISKYFLQYFVSKNVNKYQVEMNKIQNKNDEDSITMQQQFQKHYNIADTCSIILGCSEARLFKNTMESKLNSIAIYNINKFNQQASIQLHTKQLSQAFKLILNNSHNREKCLQLIKQCMGADPFLQQINVNQSKVVINNKIRFLQTVDMYINMINKNYLKLWIFNELQYKFIQSCTAYMYGVFYLSEDMSVLMTNSLDKLQNKLNMRIKRENQQMVQQIMLWKISSQIVYNLSKNCIYVDNKQQLMDLILQRVVQYVKSNINNNRNIKKVGGQLSDHISAIFTLITYMPVQTLQKFYQKQPHLNQYIYQLINQCMEALPQDSQTAKIVQKDIIKLMKMKKTLIINRQQWLELLKKFINRFQKIGDIIEFQRSHFWNLYFFLASTQDKQLIELIPFDTLAQKIVKQRNILQKKGIYNSFSSLMEKQKRQKFLLILKQEILKILDQCSKNRQWELELLKFHGLLILAQKQYILQDISPVKQGYKITKAEIQELFSSWVRPYDERECLFFQISFLELKSDKQFLSEYLFTLKHLPIYKIYFYELFQKTQVSFQFKLIHKILTHPTVENYLLYNTKQVKINYLQYYFTVVFGLNDPVNKKLYKNKYELNRILTNKHSLETKGRSKQENSVDSVGSVDSVDSVDSMDPTFKQQLKLSLFNFKYFVFIRDFYQLESWQYIYQLLLYLQSVNETKDGHLDRFLESQQIYKTAFVELLREDDEKLDSFIQKFRQQNEKMHKKNKNKNKTQQIGFSQSQIQSIKNLYRLKTFHLNQQCNYKNIQLQQLKKINISNINIHRLIIKFLIKQLDPINYQKVFLRRVTFLLAYISQLSMSMLPKDISAFSKQNQNATSMKKISQNFVDKQSQEKIIHHLKKFIFREEKCLVYLVYFLRVLGLLDKQICRQIFKYKSNLDYINVPLACSSILGRQQVIRKGYLTNEQYDKMIQQIYKVSSIVKDSSVLTYLSIISVNSLQKLKKLSLAVKNTKNWKERFLLQEQLKNKLGQFKMSVEELAKNDKQDQICYEKNETIEQQKKIDQKKGSVEGKIKHFQQKQQVSMKIKKKQKKTQGGLFKKDNK